MAEISLTPGLSSLPEMIDRLMEEDAAREPLRDYIGASQLGEPCRRKLWLSFRWARRPAWDGRMLRLFERGKAEEAPLCAYLSMAGLEMERILDDQLETDFGSHVKGHPDGIVRSGVPEAPKTVHVLEMKTHSRKSFDELAKKGVRESKPMHWVQMQCEMLGASMTLGEDIQRALYVAVCKDDDRLHIERVRLDRDAAEAAVRKGQETATDDRVPPKLSEDPGWWQCKTCQFHALCHGHGVADVNCRTCGFFTAAPDGRCYCEKWGKEEIPLGAQRRANPCHVFNPDLVPWRYIPVAGEGRASFEHPVLGTVINGEGGYRSEDLKAVAEGRPDAEAFGAPETIPF